MMEREFQELIAIFIAASILGLFPLLVAIAQNYVNKR